MYFKLLNFSKISTNLSADIGVAGIRNRLVEHEEEAKRTVRYYSRSAILISISFAFSSIILLLLPVALDIY